MADSPGSAIDLPKGGGALHGIGEKFAPDLHTGTGNFSVPIDLPSGRNGFQPSLELAYSTGGGNGLLGLGWTLAVPGVRRKTSAGVPRYDDLRDTFILAGAEDLVRVAGDYPGVARYRPRTEGLFARIEHVRHAGESYWRVRTTDGRTSWYGTPRPAGAPADWTDPAVVRNRRLAARPVCEWRLTRVTDPFGNEIRYRYDERDIGIDGPHDWDQPLLTEIAYADHGAAVAPSFVVRVRIGYEDRVDAFSDYRAGFEIRTTRRCRSIRVETHTDAVRPVREYRLGYRQAGWSGTSLLDTVQLVGFDDAGQPVEELPALRLGYTGLQPERRRFEPVSGSELPARALRGRDIDLVDVSGGGLPDIVELSDTVRYWRNLGHGLFDRPRPMPNAPSPLSAGVNAVQLLDTNGDGRADLLVSRPGLCGHFPLRFRGGWDRRSFRAYPVAPSFDLADPEVRLVDLDGDGVTDAIRSGSRMECFFNDPVRGWHETRAVERAAPEAFPDVSFSDQRVRLADMTGDGLRDIVLVHDRNVEYWPNLGRGDWGKRVSMRRAPRLPVGYDPRRILLGDLDGDGAADLVYVADGKVLVWINCGGNRWSDEPIVVHGTPPLASPDAVRFVDLLGSGTDCLMWSTDAPTAGAERLWFLDLTGGIKPYLLESMDNQLGSTTRITYTTSTESFVADEADRRTRWRTPLPFPVHVVASVEVTDAISGGKLTSRFRYHHGYWDGAEREYRGFGMVEQEDTETTLAAGDAPPLLTRTWFHQGAVGDEETGWHEWDGSGEHWPGDPDQLGHRAGVDEFLAGLPLTTASRRARRDALRALRGRVLRTELYARDGSPAQDRPYTVTEHAYGIALVVEDGEQAALVSHPTAAQLPALPHGDPRRPVFHTHRRAERTTEWERGDDPMTRCTFTGDLDPFGQPRRRTDIACPRGWRDPAQTAAGFVATRVRTAFARPLDPTVAYIFDRVASTTSYEIVAAGPTTLTALRDVPDGDPALRVIGQTRHYYDGAAFAGLPSGQIGAFGAVVRTEQLVLTEEILARAYGADRPVYLTPGSPVAWPPTYPVGFRDALGAHAGYVWHEGDGEIARGWFAPTERRRYDFHDPAGPHRGLPVAIRPPLGDAGDRDTTISQDPYGLFPAQVTDPLGLTTTAVYDYRVFKPSVTIDPNGSTTRFAFSPLGLLTASWQSGAPGEGDATEPSVVLHYDLRAFVERGEPISVHATKRVHHDTAADVPAGLRDETVEKREYSDGFGRLLQTRQRAEDIRFGAPASGDLVIPLDQAEHPGEITGRRRAPGDPVNVVVSGWQTYDNKGRPIEKLEPYFDTGWAYAPPTPAQRGASERLVYDPRGRVVRTIHADGSEQRLVQGVPAMLDQPGTFTPTPWESYVYDEQDNAARTHGAGAPVPAHHLDTPTSSVVDPAGRTIETVARNRTPSGPIQEQRTRQAWDALGNMVELTDALGRSALRSVYDLAKHQLRNESIDAGLRVTVFDAAGKPVEQRDGRGSLVLRAGDIAGRPIATWARDDTTHPVTQRERYSYGDGSRPDQPAAERAANRARKRLGKLARQFDEAGLVEYVEYDLKGNLIESTRQVVSDAALTAEWVADWSAPDAENDLDPTRYASSTRYDALSRVTLLRYPADADGRRRELRPEYDHGGALQRVTLDGEVYIDHVAHNARGQRTLIVYGNGALEASAHDPATFRLRRTWSGRFSTPAGGGPRFQLAGPGQQLRDVGYDHDLIGNTIAIHERSAGTGTGVQPDALDRILQYDATYRLLASTGRECDAPPPAPPWADTPGCTDVTQTRAYSQRYGYDAVGNLTEIAHVATGGGFTRTFTLVPGSNRLQRVDIGPSGVDYSYDANGNVTGETTSRHFGWDHANRLTSYRTQAGAGPASVQVRYLHDAAGTRIKRLVRKSSGPVESTVTINGIFEQHTRGGLTNSTLHVMDADRRVATVRVGPAFPDDGGADIPVAYQLADVLGSCTVTVGGMTAAAAGTVRREEYGTWGETTFGSYARKRYRFAGKERDDASGLYDFGARQYAPWLGRWFSADPAGPVDGPNLYAYARDNPLSRVDPTGLQSKERDAGAGPTDVSGAGAQQANAPTTNDGTATGNQGGGAGGGGAAVAGAGVVAGVSITPNANSAPGFNSTPGPAQAPGTPSVPARVPGAGDTMRPPTGYRFPSSVFRGPATAPAPPTVPATAPGAATGPGVWATRILVGPLVVLGFGAAFHGDSPIPPATPTPTVAELDKAIVEIVKQQNDILSNAIMRHDWSYIANYQPKRMAAIMRNFEKNPELAYHIFQMAYGKVLELMVDNALQVDERTMDYFEHRGGANEADWWGHGPIEGLAYDLTTPWSEAKHYERRYGENLRILKYKPPWMP